MNKPYKSGNLASCNDVAPILHRIADKWSLLIVMTLARGDCRFAELQREIAGISKYALSRTLRVLERDGLISRDVVCPRPIHVRYSLTDVGEDLRGLVDELGRWALRRHDDIHAARSRFDAALDD